MTQRPKVLIVVPYGIEKSGIEIAAVRLAKELRKRYFDISFIEKGDAHSREGFKILGMEAVDDICHYLLKRKNTYDVIYWSGLFQTTIEATRQIQISEALIEAGKRTIFFLERTGFDEPFEDKSLYLRLPTAANKLVVPNKAQKELVESRLRTNKVRDDFVEILSTGVDTAQEFVPTRSIHKKNKLRETMGYEINSTIMINAGRFNSRKGQQLLIDAWKQLENKTHLILIGSGFEQTDSTEATLYKTEKENPLLKIVEYTEQLKRSRFYQICDFSVFPGTQEGEPTALVESMACGLPVVASDIPGHTDLVVPNVSGLLFRNKKQEDLQVALQTIITSPNDRLIWGENARNIIVNSREIELVADKFARIVAEALNAQ